MNFERSEVRGRIAKVKPMVGAGERDALEKRRLLEVRLLIQNDIAEWIRGA